MSKELTRSLRSTNVLECLNWCRVYNQFDLYPVDEIKRFAIGIYQIFQGLDWENIKDQDNRNESFASACIHFMLCSERLNLSIEAFITSDFELLHTYLIDYRNLLYHISRAQQMLFYGVRAKQQRTERHKARYKEIQLTKDMVEIVSILMGSIVSAQRQQAIEDATTIMVGKL